MGHWGLTKLKPIKKGPDEQSVADSYKILFLNKPL